MIWTCQLKFWAKQTLFFIRNKKLKHFLFLACRYELKIGFSFTNTPEIRNFKKKYNIISQLCLVHSFGLRERLDLHYSDFHVFSCVARFFSRTISKKPTYLTIFECLESISTPLFSRISVITCFSFFNISLLLDAIEANVCACACACVWGGLIK